LIVAGGLLIMFGIGLTYGISASLVASGIYVGITGALTLTD